MGGDSVGGELKAWSKILGVFEGLAPREKEKKGRKEKRKNGGLRGKSGKGFLNKNRENGKGKMILRKRKKRFLWFALVRRKKNRDHRSWVDFVEEESISLEVEEHLSKVGSFRVHIWLLSEFLLIFGSSFWSF